MPGIDSKIKVPQALEAYRMHEAGFSMRAISRARWREYR